MIAGIFFLAIIGWMVGCLIYGVILAYLQISTLLKIRNKFLKEDK